MVIIYSVREYCDMHLMYSQCHGNAFRISRKYACWYPSHHSPYAKVIHWLNYRLRNIESVCSRNSRHDVWRPHCTLAVTQTVAILQRVEETSKVSMRALASELNSSRRSVHNGQRGYTRFGTNREGCKTRRFPQNA